MNRSSFLALLCAISTGATPLMVACDGAVPDPDAGPGDAGISDSGRADTGPPPDSGPPPDAGPTGCTSGCSFVELALGADHSCARRENGEVWCWGRNQEGQLGDNRTRHENCAEVGREPVDCSSTPVQVRTRTGSAIALLLDATSITAEGALSTCTIRESGQLWCWGLEGIARVNGGSNEYRFAAQRVEDFGSIHQASDGWLHACMVQGTDRHVVCYGYNESGQLGVGDRMEIRIPDATRSVLDAADPSARLGDVLEVTASGFGDTSCARTGDRVYCWGTNRDGQLGDGSTTHETCTPSMTSSYDCTDTPVMVGGVDTPLTDVGQLTSGVAHVCALGTGDAAGTVRCWGDNRAGQLALDSATQSANLPTEVSGIDDAIQVDAAGRYNCALRADGTVWCWGFNFRGQLGDGMESHGTSCTFGDTSGDCSRVPVQVSGITDAVRLATGSSHACAIHEGGEAISCWGYNDNRQLGDGSRTTRFAPVRVLGLPE